MILQVSMCLVKRKECDLQIKVTFTAQNTLMQS